MLRARNSAASTNEISKPISTLRALAAAILALPLTFAVPGPAAAQGNPFQIVSPTPNQNIDSLPIVLTLKRAPGLSSVKQVRKGQGPWEKLLISGFKIDNDLIHIDPHTVQFSPTGQYSIRTKAEEPAYANAPWNEVTFFVVIDPTVSPLQILQPSNAVYPGPPVHLVVDLVPGLWVKPPNFVVRVEIKNQGPGSWNEYATIIENGFAAADFPYQLPLLTDVPDKGVKVRVTAKAHSGPGSIQGFFGAGYFPSIQREFWFGPPPDPGDTAVSEGVTGDDKPQKFIKLPPGAVKPMTKKRGAGKTARTDRLQVTPGVSGLVPTNPCLGTAIPGYAIISVCCPVELHAIYPGVTPRLACGVASPAGDGEIFGDDVWVNIPLSAAGEFTGALAAHFTAQHFPSPVNPQSILLGDAECKLRFFHGGQMLWPHQSNGSSSSINPASVDAKVYTSKTGSAFSQYCSWAGPFPSKVEGKKFLALSEIQFTGQRQRLQTAAAADVTPELPASAARKPKKKIKAKIKGVAVVKGDNLFDPSGKAAVPMGGRYVGRFAVVSDPCKLEGKIGLARGGRTLTAAKRGATLDISGGPPFVKVSGPVAGNPAALSGNGAAAGQSANVSASANFGGGARNSMTMDYVMTVAGRCAWNTAGGGANVVTYKFTGQTR